MIRADLDAPILFRTTSANVYEATLATGSLWLRSDQYYREIEDEARKDDTEGVNGGKLTIPFRLQPENGPAIEIRGSGQIAQKIVPHYILSMHGSSISEGQLRSFGECSFGIKNISKLRR
jgi:hypothetical protein